MTGSRDQSPVVRLPSWDSVWLVCKACRHRSKGPKRQKPKELVAVLRKMPRSGKRRPLVLLSGCLKLCPRSATAVAVAGVGDAPQMFAVESKAQLQAFIPLLRREADGQDRDAG